MKECSGCGYILDEASLRETIQYRGGEDVAFWFCFLCEGTYSMNVTLNPAAYSPVEARALTGAAFIGNAIIAAIEGRA